MEKFSKDYLPLEVLEDDDYFYEVMYFFYKEGVIEYIEINDIFKKFLHEDLIINFDNYIKKYDNYFENIDLRIERVLKKSFIKNYYKNELKSKKYEGVSKTKTLEQIALYVSSIIYFASKKAYRNLMVHEEYIDLFMNMLEDLNEEFAYFTDEILSQLYDEKYLVDDTSNKMYICFDLFGQYLAEKNFNDCASETLEQLRAELHLCLYGNKEVIQKKIKKLEDEEDAQQKLLEEQFTKEIELNYPEIIEHVNLKKKQFSQEQEQELEKLRILNPGKTDEEIYEIMDSIFSQLSDKEINEIKQSSMGRMIQRSKIVYERYFKYNEENHFVDYFKMLEEVLVNLVSLKDEKKECTFVHYLFILIRNAFTYDIDSSRFTIKQKDRLVDIANEYIGYVLAYLAYLLWMRNDCDYKKEQEVVAAFKKILDAHVECQRHFKEILKEDYSGDYKYSYTPDALYKNSIVMSVLLEMSNKGIAHQVKKIVVKQLNEMLGKNYLEVGLENLNKKQAQIFEDMDTPNFSQFAKEYALVFILDYLEDSFLLAPYSAFVRFIEAEFLFFDEEEISDVEIVKEALENKEDNNPRYVSIRKIYPQLLNFINELETYTKTNDIFSDFVHNGALTSKNKNYLLYRQIGDYPAFMKNHLFELTSFIDIFYDEEFETFDFEKKMDICVSLCHRLSLIEEIDLYKEYLPSSKEIDASKTISLLEKEKEHLKQQNVSNEKKIEKLNEELACVKQENKKTQLRLTEKEIAPFKKEVNDLKRVIEQKNKEIEQLQESQEELIKLRELMFALESDADVKVNDSINLSSLIANKNIVFVGGHSTLLDKLKAKYPSTKIVKSENVDVEGVLSHADYVFMFYNFLSHGLYYRAISYLQKNKKIWDYIPYTNLEKTEMFIFQTIKKFD